MDKKFFGLNVNEPIDRVDGKAKVTGTALYAADHPAQNLAYAILVGSTIAKGRIKSVDTKSAAQAPGVLTVITHLNAPKVPGYQKGQDPSKPSPGGLRIFYNDEILYYD